MDKDNSIWNLPEHVPDPGSWDAIEQELDKWSPLQNVEDSVGSLKEYSPNSEVWTNIDKELSRPIFTWFQNSLSRYALAIAVLLIGVGFVVYHNFLPGTETINKASGHNNPAIVLKHVAENADAIVTSEEAENQPTISAIDEGDSNNKQLLASTNQREKSKTGAGNISPIVHLIHKEIETNGIVTSEKVETKSPENEYAVIHTIPNNTVDYTSVFHEDIESGEKSKFISLGLYYSREIAFTQNCKQAARDSYSIDLSLTYTMKSFFIESGVSAAFTNSKPLLGINYLQNEIAGSFEQVDSIHYDYNGLSNDLKKIYYTSEVDIYDSVEYYNVHQSKNQLSYLNIPLYLGYRFHHKKLGFSAKGGGILSILISENILEPNIPDNVRILNIDNYPVSNPKLQWRLVFGVGANYKISNHLRLNLEPQYNFIFKAASSAKCNKGQHALNIRLGLIYDF